MLFGLTTRSGFRILGTKNEEKKLCKVFDEKLARPGLDPV
jgi:hypothetical protein